MSHIEKHRHTLFLLSKASPKAARKILKGAPNSLVRAISEIALNALNGVLPLSRHRIKKLQKYKNNIRAISKASSHEGRRRVLQRGGFVAALLGAALPLLFKGVSKLVSSIKRRKAKTNARTSKR